MDSKTFCGAPWFQIRNENQGELKPCCAIQKDLSDFKGQKSFNLSSTSISQFMASGWMQYLRQSLLDGNHPTECQTCWNKEDRNVLSERQLINHRLKINKEWINSYFLRNSEDSWEIISADWKYSNFCNLGCVMCNPTDSSVLYSQWYQHRTHPIIAEVTDRDYWKKIKNIFLEEKQLIKLDEILSYPNLRFLKILGGEPLIHDGLIHRLQCLDPDKKKKISLFFITNGTKNLLEIAERLSGFKHLGFSISLDGIGDTQEWIRSGSLWNEIEKNILGVKKHHSIYVHSVIQAVNLHNIWQIWNWCSDNDVPVDFFALQQPPHLGVGIMSPDQRLEILSQVQKKLSRIKLRSHETSTIEYSQVRDSVMLVPYSPDLIAKFWQHVELHDNVNKSSIDKLELPEILKRTNKQ
jgi:molybdenum cofactor biosynthesis enzyme MoaA